MKNIMFGNSLMLLAIFLFMWCGFMKSMYALMWIAIALILSKRSIASTCSFALFSAIIVSHYTESKKLSTQLF